MNTFVKVTAVAGALMVTAVASANHNPYHNNGFGNFGPFNGMNNWGPFDGGTNLGPWNSGQNWGPFSGGNNMGPFSGEITWVHLTVHLIGDQ